MINEARENRGAKIWGEVYPYAARSTIASTESYRGNDGSNRHTYSNVANDDGTRWDKAIMRTFARKCQDERF